jgi:hypothetical protein
MGFGPDCKGGTYLIVSKSVLINPCFQKNKLCTTQVTELKAFLRGCNTTFPLMTLTDFKMY